MCTRIIHSVPTLAIYEGDDREVYLRKNWRHVRGEHIQFVGALDQEDQESMDVLQWLQTKNDHSATIGFYVELARKFLSQTKLSAARYLLTDFLAVNLGQ